MDDMNFSEKLAKLRTSLRLSQADLSASVNLHQGRISRWENAEGEPTVSQAFKLARALGVPLDYLADDEADAPPAPLTEAERYAIDIVRVDGLTKEDVLERLRRDPRARPEIKVEDVRPKRTRRA